MDKILHIGFWWLKERHGVGLGTLVPTFWYGGRMCIFLLLLRLVSSEFGFQFSDIETCRQTSFFFPHPPVPK